MINMKLRIIVMITVLVYLSGCKTTDSSIMYEGSSDFQSSHNTKFLLVPSSTVKSTLKKYSTWAEGVHAGDPIASKKSAKDIEIESYIMVSLANRGWFPATNDFNDADAVTSGSLLMIVWDFTEHFNTANKQVSSPVFGQTGSNTYTSGTVNTSGSGANYNQNTYSVPTYGITGYNSSTVKETVSYHKLHLSGVSLPTAANGSFEFTAVRQNNPSVGYLRSVATILSSCYDAIGERTAGEIITVSADPYGEDVENLISFGEKVYDINKFNK